MELVRERYGGKVLEKIFKKLERLEWMHRTGKDGY